MSSELLVPELPACRAVASTAVAPVPALSSVLVATDFSELANRAIAHACSLLPNGGTLHLINVQHTRAIPCGAYAHNLPTLVAAHLHEHRLVECRERLQELAMFEDLPEGLRVVTSVFENDNPAQGILDAAEELDVDVICLASHGHKGFEAFLLGSVTQAVLAVSPRPVLVVRSQEV